MLSSKLEQSSWQFLTDDFADDRERCYEDWKALVQHDWHPDEIADEDIQREFDRCPDPDNKELVVATMRRRKEIQRVIDDINRKNSETKKSLTGQQRYRKQRSAEKN